MNEANDMTSTAPLLRALPGGRAEDASQESVCEIEISRAAVRAGDRHEPWTLPTSPALRALAAAARAAGIELELALRLAIEHGLVVADLRAVGVDPAGLDAIAARARVSGVLDAAGCAYLRRLTRRDGAAGIAVDGTGARGADTSDESAPPLGDAIIVGLPSRLTARLLAAGPEELLEGGDLDVEAALAWEIAAVLDGRTISEWAPLTALRVRAAGGADLR